MCGLAQYNDNDNRNTSNIVFLLCCFYKENSVTHVPVPRVYTLFTYYNMIAVTDIKWRSLGLLPDNTSTANAITFVLKYGIYI